MHILRQSQDGLDPIGRSQPLRHDYKDARDTEHGIQNDRKIGQKGDDDPWLGQPLIDAKGTDNDHQCQPDIQKEVHQGWCRSHRSISSGFRSYYVLIDVVKAFFLVICFGQGLDHPSPSHIFTDSSH